MSASLGALFAQFASQAVQLDKIDLSADGERITLYITAPAFDAELPARLKAELSARFPKRRAVVLCCFPPQSLGGDALPLIADELRAGGFPVNGFLNGAKMMLEGDTATVSLPSKTASVLGEMQFEEKFCRAVQRMFSRNVQLKLTEPEAASTVPVGDKPSGTMSAPAASKAAAAPKKRRTDRLNDADMANKLLPLENDEFELVLGK